MEAREAWAELANDYRRWAATAVSSPTFYTWAQGVAYDAEVAQWISELPAARRQPNLVFAAARWHGVPAPGPYEGLRTALLEDDGSIRDTILTRATQTNEARRMTCLTPALALLPGPLALIEVGASAGLCLYPDRWGYEWRGESGATQLSGAPRLTCDVTGPVPLPAELPEVRYRGGIDLNPLDVCDADQMAWLENLVWPEHDERR